VNENVIRWMVTRPEHKKAVVPVEAVIAQETTPEPAPAAVPVSEPTPAPEA